MTEHSNQSPSETIVVGGGCFWCIEAVFQSFRGVEKVESGYAGGSAASPTYEEVSAGTTGHAEVVLVTFHPQEISLKQVLTIFFHAHDPTTKNRQGADVGTQYRSVILYSSDEQRKVAESVRDEIANEKLWAAPLVTEIKALEQFYRAEDYHQNYYASNPTKPYCSIVIGPKLQKVRKEFHSLLKE